MDFHRTATGRGVQGAGAERQVGTCCSPIDNATVGLSSLVTYRYCQRHDHHTEVCPKKAADIRGGDHEVHYVLRAFRRNMLDIKGIFIPSMGASSLGHDGLEQPGRCSEE